MTTAIGSDSRHIEKHLHIIYISKKGAMQAMENKLFEMLTYEDIKQRLRVRLVPQEKADRMKAVSISACGDMAFTYAVELADLSDKTLSIYITEEVLTQYGITAEQLHEDAMEATVNARPAHVNSMEQILKMLGAISDGGTALPLYVVNTDYPNGAVSIFYPGMLRTVARITRREKYFILPSSVHEVLILPFTDGASADDLRQMVTTINATEVSEEEKLSDNVYIYDAVTDKVAVA